MLKLSHAYVHYPSIIASLNFYYQLHTLAKPHGAHKIKSKKCAKYMGATPFLEYRIGNKIKRRHLNRKGGAPLYTYHALNAILPLVLFS